MCFFKTIFSLLIAIESDLRPLNIGPSYAWKKATFQEHLASIVDRATLKKSMPRADRDKALYNYHLVRQTKALGQCIPPPRNILPVPPSAESAWAADLCPLTTFHISEQWKIWKTIPVSISSPKINHLFTGPLPTFPENFTQIHLEVFVQSR